MSAIKLTPPSHVTERKLHRRSGSEGPAHDPYGFVEYSVTTNGRTVKLHCGLGTFLTVNGRRVVDSHSDAELASIFEEMTGISPKQFEKYYDRVHPWFDDPMGNPSDYI